MSKKPSPDLLTPLPTGTFRFRCHRDVPCFTKCCADLRLVLTPYDVLRLKNRLGLPSPEFLDTYTDTRLENASRFPGVFLNMRPDGEKKCPFLTSDGCSVYEDRPGACRLYPVARASLHTRGGGKEKFFLVQEAHCLGFLEDRKWTVGEWMKGEGLDEYNTMNDLWLEITSNPRSLGPEKGIPPKVQMYFMACYNLDRFRDFLFHSGFFNRFEIDPARREDLASDDVVLLQFAFQWLKYSLFGEKTLAVKNDR
ncbi:MAG: YkgJ family cysteine cluster protein [Deltaproteobacteria bacterium]|nr:YkgJ family cysteine cluster protein [Deltaproteobacteria bacterium]